MNYQESREYIDRVTREIPSVLGLDHMREMMKRLGNPQDDLKYVHVAGTNGKGSVIAFLYSVLSEAGYRVGRYVSNSLFLQRKNGDFRKEDQPGQLCRIYDTGSRCDRCHDRGRISSSHSI